MNIQIYTILPAKIRVQVEKIDKESFAWAHHQTPNERALGRDKFCSKDDRAGYVIANHASEVIGAVELYMRRIDFQGSSIALGGIGGLCTRKDKRKNGVGTLLLNKAMEELRRTGADISYICTEVEKEWMVRFYENVGFTRLTHGHTYTGKSGTRYTEFDGMIAPVCSEEFFQRILRTNKPFDIGRGNW